MPQVVGTARELSEGEHNRRRRNRRRTTPHDNVTRSSKSLTLRHSRCSSHRCSISETHNSMIEHKYLKNHDAYLKDSEMELKQKLSVDEVEKSEKLELKKKKSRWLNYIIHSFGKFRQYD
ncbi:hypothetical protein SNEBB_004448 [Seison nebaliae]|nr:hypothetical protein SNEBB_004448 [Seison nebaliae]